MLWKPMEIFGFPLISNEKQWESWKSMEISGKTMKINGVQLQIKAISNAVLNP